MSFRIKDDSVLVKYNELWKKIKKALNTKFHSMPVYDKKFIKAKVREFNGVIKTNFYSDEVPKEGVNHTCIAYITIDCVMRMESLFRRMQIQNKENKDAWIYRHLIRVRF